MDDDTERQDQQAEKPRGRRLARFAHGGNHTSLLSFCLIIIAHQQNDSKSSESS
jgi:hypothetical protein